MVLRESGLSQALVLLDPHVLRRKEVAFGTAMLRWKQRQPIFANQVFVVPARLMNVVTLWLGRRASPCRKNNECWAYWWVTLSHERCTLFIFTCFTQVMTCGWIWDRFLCFMSGPCGGHSHLFFWAELDLYTPLRTATWSRDSVFIRKHSMGPTTNHES